VRQAEDVTEQNNRTGHDENNCDSYGLMTYNISRLRIKQP